MKILFVLMILLLITPLSGISQNIPPDRPDKSFVSVAPFHQFDDNASFAASLNQVNIPIAIPNAFSPNGDGINDHFRISGIEKYPYARLFVYSISNKKVFEKSHYGNINFWGSEVDAFWDGNSNIRNTNALPNGTYIYILDLANGNQALIKLGTVFIKR